VRKQQPKRNKIKQNKIKATMETFKICITSSYTKKFTENVGKYSQRMQALGYDASKESKNIDYESKHFRTNRYLIKAIEDDPLYAQTTQLIVCQVPTRFIPLKI
jgi:pyruvate dehydrogenase complex dehydrogenase (E1) component